MRFCKELQRKNKEEQQNTINRTGCLKKWSRDFQIDGSRNVMGVFERDRYQKKAVCLWFSVLRTFSFVLTTKQQASYKMCFDFTARSHKFPHDPNVGKAGGFRVPQPSTGVSAAHTDSNELAQVLPPASSHPELMYPC